MRLTTYTELIYDVIHSRRSLHAEQLTIEQFDDDHSVLIEGRLRFWDSTLLRFHEELIERGVLIAKLDYVYHHQTAEGQLIFRYDNSPHYPDIATFPHHKHVAVGSGKELIESANPPTLLEVLREIEALLSSR
jgi:hypothetical protein